MPIKQRCKSCRRYVDYGKSCPCRGSVGSWVFLVTKIRGKVYRKGIGVCSLTKAKLKEHQWLLDLHNGIEKPFPRLSEVFDRYKLKLQAEGKPYHSESKLFLDRMLDQWGDIQANELKAEHTKAFHVYLREVGYSPAYCDRHIAVGKAAFNYALPDAPNPFKRVDMYHPDNTLVRFLSPKEEEKLLEAAQKRKGFGPPLYDILIVAIHTGLRKKNILRLHVSEIDFAAEAITLRQKRNRSHTVPMNQVVINVLRPRVENAPPSGWIFPNKKTGQPWIQCEKSFQTAKKKAGITRPFRFHDLRHHFARKVLLATGNLRMAGVLLGHTNPATTTKYAHLILEDQQRAVDMLVPQPEKPEERHEELPASNDDGKLLH